MNVTLHVNGHNKSCSPVLSDENSRKERHYDVKFK